MDTANEQAINLIIIMNLFKKIHIQIRSGIEELLNSVENHEAVTEAAIREYQEYYAKARVKLDRIKAREVGLREKAEKARKDEGLWKGRATSIAGQDRTKALACMKRAKDAEAQAQILETDLENMRQTVSEVEQTVDAMRCRIEEIKRKRDQLSVRDYRTRTLSAASSSGREDPELGAIFERWEERILTREVISEREQTSGDNLARELDQKENEAALEAELDALIASGGEEKAS